MYFKVKWLVRRRKKEADEEGLAKGQCSGWFLMKSSRNCGGPTRLKIADESHKIRTKSDHYI